MMEILLTMMTGITILCLIAFINDELGGNDDEK